MNRILILFGHPAYQRSTINAALRNAVEHLEGITFHDLYARYPDFLIDVPCEQHLCESHDVIVFQHPFYWYSTPAMIRRETFDSAQTLGGAGQGDRHGRARQGLDRRQSRNLIILN